MFANIVTWMSQPLNTRRSSAGELCDSEKTARRKIETSDRGSEGVFIDVGWWHRYVESNNVARSICKLCCCVRRFYMFLQIHDFISLFIRYTDKRASDGQATSLNAATRCRAEARDYIHTIVESGSFEDEGNLKGVIDVLSDVESNRI